MKRWTVRLSVGLLIVVLAGYGIRSILLPAASAAVFVEYREDASWKPAPESPLFQGGQIEFAGFEPTQLGGEDLGAWDEVVIVNFDRAADYREFVGRISAEDDIARYHLLKIAPQAPELLHFMNWRLRGYRDDASIDPGGQLPIDAAVLDTKYLDEWRNLFEGPYRDGIVMLNLLTREQEPQDPAGGPDSDASAEDLIDRYSQVATRLLGKLGGQMSVMGTVDRVVVGPAIRHYDVYAFVFYPSVDIFEVMFTARARVEAQVHQLAGLNVESSAGYWVKPYAEVTPAER